MGEDKTIVGTQKEDNVKYNIFNSELDLDLEKFEMISQDIRYSLDSLESNYDSIESQCDRNESSIYTNHNHIRELEESNKNSLFLLSVLILAYIYLYALLSGKEVI